MSQCGGWCSRRQQDGTLGAAADGAMARAAPGCLCETKAHNAPMAVVQGRTGLPDQPSSPRCRRFDRSPERHYGPGTGDNWCVEHTASLIARWLSAGDEGDVDAFDDLLHSDVVVHDPRGLSIKNLASEKQIWRDAVAAMPDLHHDVQEVVTQGSVQASFDGGLASRWRDIDN
jgi:hypothetical protein